MMFHRARIRIIALKLRFPFKSKQGILSFIIHFLQSLFIIHLSKEGKNLSKEGKKSFCHQAHKSGINGNLLLSNPLPNPKIETFR